MKMEGQRDTPSDRAMGYLGTPSDRTMGYRLAIFSKLFDGANTKKVEKKLKSIGF